MRYLGTIILCVVCGFAFGSTVRAEAPATRPASGPVEFIEKLMPEPDGSPEGVIRAAQRAAADIQKQQELGEAITPSFIAIKSMIARRLYEARVQETRQRGDLKAELAALEAFVDSVRQTRTTLRNRYVNGYDGPELPILLADLDLAEAKLLASREKAGRLAVVTTAPADLKTNSEPAIEKLATAEQGWRLAIKTYEQNRQSFESVAAWASRVGESARVPTIPQDRRVEVLKAFLDQARQLEKSTDAAMKAGLSGQLDVVGAKYIRLQAERWLREAEADK